jgi:hypothetical protein
VRGYLICHIATQRPRLFQHLRYWRRCRASRPTSGLPVYVLAKRPPTVNSTTLTSAVADPPITADPRLASLFLYKRWTFAHARHETTPPPPPREPAPPSLQRFVWLLLWLTRGCASRHCGGRCSPVLPAPLAPTPPRWSAPASGRRHEPRHGPLLHERHLPHPRHTSAECKEAMALEQPLFPCENKCTFIFSRHRAGLGKGVCGISIPLAFSRPRYCPSRY